jgi:hypothetical protein
MLDGWRGNGRNKMKQAVEPGTIRLHGITKLKTLKRKRK